MPARFLSSTSTCRTPITGTRPIVDRTDFFRCDTASYGSDEHPGALLDGLLATGDICALGSNGIAFLPVFHAHIVTVNIEFPDTPIDIPDPADDPFLRMHRGSFTFTSDPMVFDSADALQLDTAFTAPVSGRRDVVVTRRLLVDPYTFTEPVDVETDPTGLEHWTITVLPEHGTPPVTT